jgi:hypothetical protein
MPAELVRRPVDIIATFGTCIYACSREGARAAGCGEVLPGLEADHGRAGSMHRISLSRVCCRRHR